MIAPTHQTQELSELAEQSARLLGLYAGYLGTWTIELGLRAGLIRSLAARSGGATSGELASDLGLDAEYVEVWCHAAFAASLVDLTDDGRYVLMPQLATLLLDADAPEYLGGVARACVALRETFVDLRRFVRSGQRKARNRVGTEWIAAASDMSLPFYQHLAGTVVPKMPSVAQALHDGGRVLDLTCGTCAGLSRVARAFPNATFTAVDGDWYSIEQARVILREQNLTDRFDLIHGNAESLRPSREHDVAIVNLALHGALDIARVIEVARDALRPGGTLLVSVLPTPGTVEARRNHLAQVVYGMQYFKALLGDRMLPICRIETLLERTGFRDIGVIEVASLQTVIFGTR